MGTNNKLIQVTFLHPRDGGQYQAEIGPQTSGEKALEGLVKAKFLTAAGPKEAYALQLQRTNSTLPLSASLVASGVEAADTIAVVMTNAGAGV